MTSTCKGCNYNRRALGLNSTQPLLIKDRQLVLMHCLTSQSNVLMQVLEKDIKGQTAKRVVMTITDGDSTDFDETEYQATQLRGEGVRLVWLFVFENSQFILGQMEYEKREMEKNGDPTVKVTRFDDLGDDLVSKMLEISCQGKTSKGF